MSTLGRSLAIVGDLLALVGRERAGRAILQGVEELPVRGPGRVGGRGGETADRRSRQSSVSAAGIRDLRICCSRSSVLRSAHLRCRRQYGHREYGTGCAEREHFSHCRHGYVSFWKNSLAQFADQCLHPIRSPGQAKIGEALRSANGSRPGIAPSPGGAVVALPARHVERPHAVRRACCRASSARSVRWNECGPSVYLPPHGRSFPALVALLSSVQDGRRGAVADRPCRAADRRSSRPSAWLAL